MYICISRKENKDNISNGFVQHVDFVYPFLKVLFTGNKSSVSPKAWRICFSAFPIIYSWNLTFYPFLFKCYDSCITFPSWINILPNKTMSEIHIINPHFVLSLLHSPVSRNHSCILDPSPLNCGIQWHMYVTFSSWIFNSKTRLLCSVVSKKGIILFQITLCR